MYECIYESDNIKLRKATISDQSGLYDIHQDPDVMAFYGEMDTTEVTIQKEIDWFNDLFQHNAGRWVIEDKTSGNYIGDIGVFNYHPTHKKAEIGFKLAKGYWGKGIMTESIQAVMNIAFNEWNYNRVEAFVDTRNTACIKLLEKNHFTREGILRDYEFEHGHFVDLAIFSLLKREF